MKKKFRSAKDGKFVSKETAKENPETTVAETTKAKKEGSLIEQFFALLAIADWQNLDEMFNNVLNGAERETALSRCRDALERYGK